MPSSSNDPWPTGPRPAKVRRRSVHCMILQNLRFIALAGPVRYYAPSQTGRTDKKPPTPRTPRKPRATKLGDCLRKRAFPADGGVASALLGRGLPERLQRNTRRRGLLAGPASRPPPGGRVAARRPSVGGAGRRR